jgi:hypothetical protein
VAGKGKPLLAWEKVTAPKDKGGLRLKNLRIMNEALLIKHLHKFYNKEDIPWVQLIWNTHYTNGQVPYASPEKGSFWFRDIMKFCDHFRGIASAHVGRGDTTLLWQDVWNGHHLKSELPRIYSYARNRKISVALFCSTSDVHQHFHTPISSQAAQELITLHQIVSQAQVNNQGRDKWTYIWGSKRYTPSKFYNLNFTSIQAPQPFKWIWRTKVSKKIKIFIWLLFRDRINSRNLLKRKHFKIEGDDYNCVLCNLNIEELSYHLIFQCPFSSECWDYLIFPGIIASFSLTPFRKPSKSSQLPSSWKFSL